MKELNALEGSKYMDVSPETGELQAMQNNENNIELFKSISRLTKELHQAATFDELLRITRNELERVLGFRHTWVYRRNPNDINNLELVSISSESEELNRQKLTKISLDGDKMLEEALSSERAVYVEEASLDPRANQKIVAQMGNRTIINCLITIEEQTLGILGAGSFGNEGINKLSPTDCEYFETVANLVAVSLDRINYKEMSSLDPLTHLNNRRSMLEKANQLQLSSKRHGRRFGVIYIDLNNFKEINDQHGHNVGDLVLLHFAMCLTNSIRQTDIIARIGGDEFVIIFSDITDIDCLNIAKENILNYCSKPMLHNGQKIQCEFSCGYSMYPIDGENIGDLLEVADNRMYQNKKSNTVAC